MLIIWLINGNFSYFSFKCIRNYSINQEKVIFQIQRNLDKKIESISCENNNNNNNNNEHLYSALQKNTTLYNETKQYIQLKIQAIYTMTHNEKNQYLGNKWVFNWRLKTVTDGASLMLTGSPFQSRGPHTWNELSPAWRFERGMASLVASEEERSRRRLPSVLLEALYNFKISARYLGAWLFRDL